MLVRQAFGSPFIPQFQLLLIHLSARIPQPFLLNCKWVQSAIIRFKFMRHFLWWAVPVDPAIAFHAVKSLLKGLHHGMGQLLGLQLALTLYSMAVHLVGQVIVDLPIDPSKDVWVDVVVSSAVGYTCYLKGIHVDRRLTFVVQVMQPDLERANFQKGVSWVNIIPGERMLLPQLNDWFLCAAWQKLHPCCGNFTQIRNLQRRAKTDETQTADCWGFLPSQGKFLSLEYESTHIPSLTTPPISHSSSVKQFSNFFPDICFLDAGFTTQTEMLKVPSLWVWRDFALFSSPGQPSCRAHDRTSKPMLPSLRASAKKVQSVSFNWGKFQASGSHDANYFFFPSSLLYSDDLFLPHFKH